MAKRSAVKSKKPVEGINPRQACPCGSGKRYKACHGLSGGPVEVPVGRPFEGLAGECELIALREFVPSATAPLSLAVETDRTVTLASQEDKPEDDRERLQDMLDSKADLEPTLHTDFSWWLPEDEEPTGEVALSLERANAAIMPTDRVGPAAYWVDAGDRAHLRWVRPEPEEKLLFALARLSARGALGLGEGSRYAGSFRAHGLLVPVWDLDREQHAREWTTPAEELGTRLDEALASLETTPLTSEERRARDGLIGRQVTIR